MSEQEVYEIPFCNNHNWLILVEARKDLEKFPKKHELGPKGSSFCGLGPKL